MRFSKMQGCGNDYIYVNGVSDRPADPAAAAVKVSDRHFGIGSDGLILINPSDRADFEMEMYNADGSRGKMCGNGIRCVGRYVYEKGLTDKKRLRIETLAGIKDIELFTGEDGLVKEVRADMGIPELSPSAIPVNLEGGRILDVPHVFGGREYLISCVSMGNPHCVIFTDEDVRGLDLPRIGPVFENDPIFPDRVNTEFIIVLDRKRLRMRVWERGSGETLACGTGACAAAFAAYMTGRADSEVTVSLLGGDLRIDMGGEGEHLFMTGPAEWVFEGEIDV